MKSKLVRRYWCDFCGKQGGSAGHIKKHELHCTKNPGRQCGVCKLIPSNQAPMSTLLDCIPRGIQVPDEECPVIWNSEENVRLIKLALENLKKATEECPACIMAAFRQRGIPIPMVTDATGWTFKARMDLIWVAFNDAQRDTSEWVSQ